MADDEFGFGENPNDEIEEAEVDESVEIPPKKKEKPEKIEVKSEKQQFVVDVSSVQSLLDTVTFATTQLEKATKGIDIDKASTNFERIEAELVELKQSISKANIDTLDLSPIQNAVFELEKVGKISEVVKKFKVKSFVFSIFFGLLLGISAILVLYLFGSKIMKDEQNFVLSKEQFKYYKTQKTPKGQDAVIFIKKSKGK